MSVMEVIAAKIHESDVIPTPSGRSKFKVRSVSKQEIVLGLGKGYRWGIAIPSACWEGISPFLRGNGWILIGAVHGIPKPGTLDHYVQRFTRGVSGASYVAAILERVGLVEIDRRRPHRVRLLDPQSPR